jgi:uncharacterized membrane protein YhaH (DUF805 family)
MTPAEVLFGFEGRISRGMFNACMAAIGAAVLVDRFVVFDVAPLVLPAGFYPMLVVFGTLFAGTVLLLAASAVAVKRLHDLGRSGFGFVGFVLLPLAVAAIDHALWQSAAVHFGALGLVAWGLTDLMFARGEPGENRYGRDPLEGIADLDDEFAEAEAG